jgi:hypothetical protein
MSGAFGPRVCIEECFVDEEMQGEVEGEMRLQHGAEGFRISRKHPY